MSDSTTTDTCSLCGHTSEYQEFVWNRSETASICQNAGACVRRCKRNQVIAEMQEMRNKPARNRKNEILLGIVLACGLFLGSSTAIALSWLISRSGF